jgi:hypothetical protein
LTLRVRRDGIDNDLVVDGDEEAFEMNKGHRRRRQSSTGGVLPMSL